MSRIRSPSTPGQAALFEQLADARSSGVLTVNSGFVSLNEANTIGSVSVGAATLALGASGALGTGMITVNGGELLGTANATLANALSLAGNVTIAAANGTTLNENASAYQLAANTALNFGAPGEGGTVLWHTGAGSIVPAWADINIQAGTLKGADSRFASIFGNSPQTTVAAGATLDLGGFNATLNELLGAGAVTDSGAAATLTLDATDSPGTISGALSLAFDGDASLSGLESMTGGATLNGPVTVTSTGTYDIVANANISGAPPPSSSTAACSRRRAAAGSATSRPISSTMARSTCFPAASCSPAASPTMARSTALSGRAAGSPPSARPSLPTSTATAFPTSCGRTRAARPRSGK